MDFARDHSVGGSSDGRPVSAQAAPADPLADLLTLHDEGAVAARWPDVRRIVAGLPDDELPRAGRILARTDPGDVLARHPGLGSVTVAVTGHGTLADLVPALTAELTRSGLVPRTILSDFDGYVFDLMDPGSALYAARPDLVLCVLDPSIVLDELARRFDELCVMLGERRFFFGDHVSVADLAVFGQLSTLRSGPTPQGARLLDARPSLAALFDRVDAASGVRATINGVAPDGTALNDAAAATAFGFRCCPSAGGNRAWRGVCV